MKKVLLLVAMIVVGSAAVSFVVARWVATRHQPVTAARLHDAGWLKQELQLTDEQALAVEQLETQFKKQLAALCETHCAARFALGDELMKSSVDTAKCRTSVEKMNAAQAESEEATLAQILKVRALLNDQQAQRYARLIHDQVCSMPMGAP